MSRQAIPLREWHERRTWVYQCQLFLAVVFASLVVGTLTGLVVVGLLVVLGN